VFPAESIFCRLSGKIVHVCRTRGDGSQEARPGPSKQQW
jgi:hypothetical protein